MSKIYTQYLKLKQEKKDCFYLFKSGIFYIFVGDDAKTISPILNLKLTNLNDDIEKCGFPVKSLDTYINSLVQNNICFEIIDPKYSKIENYSDYMNNQNLQKVITNILDIDFNNISYKEAFNLLSDFQETLKQIYN